MNYILRDFYIVILCSTKWSSNYLGACPVLISKTEKCFCYIKVRVIFSYYISQLGIYYHKQPEKPQNLKRCISWKIITKKFKTWIALKLPKAEWCALNGCFGEIFVDWVLSSEGYLTVYGKFIRYRPNTWKLHSKLATAQ